MKIIAVKGDMLELQAIEAGWGEDLITEVAITGHFSLMAALEVTTENRITQWLSMKEMGHKTLREGKPQVGHQGLLQWVRENGEEWDKALELLERGGWMKSCERINELRKMAHLEPDNSVVKFSRKANVRISNLQGSQPVRF